MAVKSTSLITLAAARDYIGLGADETKWDGVIEVLIDSVSDSFSKACDRVFGKTTYTSIELDGPDGADLILPHLPVSAAAAAAPVVVEDGVTLTEDSDYYIDYANGIIHRIGGDWVKGWKKVVVTFTGGYVVQDQTPATGETALPSDLKLACLRQVAQEWKAHKLASWGEVSRSFPDGSVSRVQTGQFLDEVQEVLDRHMRI